MHWLELYHQCLSHRTIYGGQKEGVLMRVPSQLSLQGSTDTGVCHGEAKQQTIPITVNHFAKWTKQIPRNSILKLQVYSLEKQKVSRFPQKRETAQTLQSRREYASLSLHQHSELHARSWFWSLFSQYTQIFQHPHNSHHNHMLRVSELGGLRVQPHDFSDWYTRALPWRGGGGSSGFLSHYPPLPASLILHGISWNGWPGQLWKKEQWSSGRHPLLPWSNWTATPYLLLLLLTSSSILLGAQRKSSGPGLYVSPVNPLTQTAQTLLPS